MSTARQLPPARAGEAAASGGSAPVKERAGASGPRGRRPLRSHSSACGPPLICMRPAHPDTGGPPDAARSPYLHAARPPHLHIALAFGGGGGGARPLPDFRPLGAVAENCSWTLQAGKTPLRGG